MIKSILDATLSLWIERNQALHGKDYEENLAICTSTADDQINWFYSNKDLFTDSDCTILFASDLSEILDCKFDFKLNWSELCKNCRTNPNIVQHASDSATNTGPTATTPDNQSTTTQNSVHSFFQLHDSRFRQ